MKNSNLDDLLEIEEKEKNNIANILMENPFFTGLHKLTKKQLITLVECCAESLDLYINLGGKINDDERDFKDLYFDQKCCLIETLCCDFFHNEEVE